MLRAIAIVAATAALAAAPVDDRPGDASSLSWLSGCWELRSGARLVEEQWMSPRAGLLLGMSRTSRNDSIVEFEHVRIETRESGVFYVASPSRQATAEFKASAMSDTSVVFENPAHDFPVKIMYRRLGADSIVASIEGQRGGRVRTIAYPYGRVACR